MALIRDLANRPEIESAQTSIRNTWVPWMRRSPRIGEKPSARTRRTALSILGAKGTPEEVAAFRQWLYGIAEKVAKAAKEGGFLGFGGTQVSERNWHF